MDREPLISVIIPVYEVEKFLQKSILSVSSQSYVNIEIILIDDGSLDCCGVICDTWARQDLRVIVIHKSNGGLSDARNVGVAIAAGAYIGFVDSDDWIAPEMYERLLNALTADQSEIAACSVNMVWEDSSPERPLTRQDACVLTRDEAQRELLKEGKLKQPVWYKLYQADRIREIPFERGKYHEDVFWSYQAIGNAEKVSIIPYVGYYYLQRPGSIMGEGFSLKRLDVMEAYCKRYEYFKSAFPNLQDQALTAIWLNCIYNGQMAMKYADNKTQKHVFSLLQGILTRYPIKRKQYHELKWTHRMWIDIARVSLPAASFVKKAIGVGW